MKKPKDDSLGQIVDNRLTLTKREKAQIKAKLCIPWGSPFPRCPHKNRRVTHYWQKRGDYRHEKSNKAMLKFHVTDDYSHDHPGHICDDCRATEKRPHHCDKCVCSNVGGQGTDHFGYGWCFAHERTHSKEACARFALFHLKAIQTRNPSAYIRAARYLEKTQERGEEAAERLHLLGEMDQARGMMGVLIDKLDGRLNSPDDPEQSEEQRNDPSNLTGKHDKDGTPLPMTDLETMKMINDLMKTQAMLMKTQRSMDDDKYIHADELNAWMGRFARALRYAYPNDDDKRKIVEIMKAARDPLYVFEENVREVGEVSPADIEPFDDHDMKSMRPSRLEKIEKEEKQDPREPF